MLEAYTSNRSESILKAISCDNFEVIFPAVYTKVLPVVLKNL